MKLKNKVVGVWGYGIVGQSAVKFLQKQDVTIQVMDKHVPTINIPKVTFFDESQKEKFFSTSDCIIPSPGIDIRAIYEKYEEKWITELDLFFEHFKKPIIAITGSVGKTTITTLLGQMFKKVGKKILTGGNIGIPCLDLVEQQIECDFAVIEVSSFQLEHCKKFCPDVVVITNIFQNHLDRHGSMEEYIKAKCKCIHDKKQQTVLLPYTLRSNLRGYIKSKNNVYYFSDQRKKFKNLFYINQCYQTIYLYGQKKQIAKLKHFPNITFEQNWLIIASILHLLGIDIHNIDFTTKNFTLPHHRLELFCSKNNINFYNDSKATTPAATLAAIQKLQGKPIHLFLGGLGKGIDRESMIHHLQHKIKTVYCFGAEATSLYQSCQKYKISAYPFPDLETALNKCFESIVPGDNVLFSPSGSSFDLFRNFGHRGEVFKQMVREKID